MKTKNILFAAVLALVVSGCGSKPKYSEFKLPLPPLGDNGVIEGQFVQVDYGFGIPLPAKWFSIPLTPDQEAEEVAEISDPDHKVFVRVSAQWLSPPAKFSEKYWEELSSLDLRNRQLRIKGSDKGRVLKIDNTLSWILIPYHIADYRGTGWLDQAYALNKGDLLIGLHVNLSEKDALTDKGQQLLKDFEVSLTKIKWYTPIGPEGVSVERYQLERFTSGFRAALESRNLTRVSAYIDESYPNKAKWDQWYKDLTAVVPGETSEIKASLSGLVINGDYATMTFVIVKKGSGKKGTERVEKSFRLSKKEGRWKIKTPVEK